VEFQNAKILNEIQLTGACQFSGGLECSALGALASTELKFQV
jgi:hypothetical protein